MSHADRLAYSRSRPCRVSEVPQWDFEADVLVVGFGSAGASAALEARRAGADVLLFEVTAASGGTSALSGGEIYMGGHGGTPIQRHAGFSDDTEDFYRYLVMAGGPNADEAKCRAYADDCAEHYQWLVAQGVRYKNSFIKERIVEPVTDDCLLWSGSEEAYPFSEHAKPCPRGHTPQWMGMGGGKYLMDVLAEQVNKAGVRVQYEARVIALIAEDDNTVRGVVVKIDGVDRYARARGGVVLAAGGFIMNRDMVKKHAPMLLRAQYPLGTVDDGSGVQLGQSVGGAAINMSEGFVTLPWYPPERLIRGIFINERGQRFINEDCYHGRVSHHALQQGGNRIFILLDHDSFGEPDFGQHFKITIGATGDTWDEVEAELDLPAGSLTSTVALYNRYAEQGQDPLYRKGAKWLKPLATPPFVALDCRIDHALYTTFTMGGLDTSIDGEVFDDTRRTIPGLYAAGRTTCGLPRWGEGYSSGMSLADATYFGRRAGKRAAAAANAAR